jgi:hypothetical protein
VVLEERSPGLRGWLRAVRHETGNGPLGNLEAELEQLTMNARGTPERIGVCHGADEVPKSRADRRSTRSHPSGLPGPESAKALPMPANHGLGANDVAPSVQPAHRRESQTQNARSRRPNHRRFERWSRASCCRSARFSSARSVWVLSVRGAQESEYEGHCAPASLDANRSSSATIEFWQTTAPCGLDRGAQGVGRFSPGYNGRAAIRVTVGAREQVGSERVYGAERLRVVSVRSRSTRATMQWRLQNNRRSSSMPPCEACAPSLCLDAVRTRERARNRTGMLQHRTGPAQE